MGPHKLKFHVSLRSMLIWLSYRDIEAPEGSRRFQRLQEDSRGFQRIPEGVDRTVGMAMISGINQLGPKKFMVQVS